MTEREETAVELISHVLANHQRVVGALTMALRAAATPIEERESMAIVCDEIDSSLRGLRDGLESSRKHCGKKSRSKI